MFYILLHRSDWIICLKYCYKRFCSFLVHLLLLQVLLVLLFSSISKLNFKNFIFFLLNSSSRLNIITLIRTCINDIFVHTINNFFMTVLLLCSLASVSVFIVHYYKCFIRNKLDPCYCVYRRKNIFLNSTLWLLCSCMIQ